jgi:hypothetical protein
LTRVGDGVVIVDHSGGWQTVYAHLRLPFEVTQGKALVRGQVIGHVGSTGTTQAHLHFETKLSGVHRDPWPLLDQQEVGLAVDLTGYKRINNRQTTLTGRANFKADAKVSAPTWVAYPAGTGFTPECSVKGDSVSGSDLWYGGFGNTPKGVQFGFIHSSVIGPLTPIEAAGGFTQAQLDTAVAKAVMDAKVAAAKAGANATAKAAADFAATLPGG